MKSFTYPNTKQWKIASSVALSLLVATTYMEVAFRNPALTWSGVFIAGLVAAFGIRNQYSSYHNLMEIKFVDDMIVAKRWGGLAQTIEMSVSNVRDISHFELGSKRKGISVSDGIRTILVGESISNFDVLISVLRKKLPHAFRF